MSIPDPRTVVWLSRGRYATVDPEDKIWLSQWTWQYNSGYARRHLSRLICPSRRIVKMHRELWTHHYGVEPKVHIDHIDRDPLNNRLSNLRLASYTLNNLNKGGNTNATGYRGIYLRESGRYQAMIGCGYRNISLGYYDTAKEAYAVYCAAQKDLIASAEDNG